MKYKKSTYKELATYLEVSKKTIERDIDKLSSMGIPIYTQNGYNGGVFISSDYKFDKTFFTIDDIEKIILAFYIFNCLNKQTYNNVLEKLYMILPEEILFKENELLEYIKIDLLEKPIDMQKNIYSIINTALDLEKNLELEYNNNKFICSPIYYILRPKGLYLEVLNDNRIEILFIEDIKSCSLIEEEFDRIDILEKFNK